jgi:hypothetical protein
MTRARMIQSSAMIAMFSILALAPELETGYVGAASAAGLGLAGSKLDIEPRSDLTLIGCSGTVLSHCEDVENSCNESRHPPRSRYECRRRYNLCALSTRCLEGGESIPWDKGPRCIQWIHPYSGNPGCNPSRERCICGRHDDRSVEVQAPGSASGGSGRASVHRTGPRTHTITGSGLW